MRISLSISCTQLLLLVLPIGSGGLEMLGIDGPTWVNSGETVELVVKYDVGRDAIYSVKWYKDGGEIWRYVPSDKPSFKNFEVPGITILDSSRPHKLVFILDGPKGSGVYKCEISVEAPTFYTLKSVHNLTVVVAPSGAPEISGVKDYYAVGDIVDLNCTVHRSKPAADLKWKLNGVQVSGSMISHKKSIFHESSGLETSILGLRFRGDAEDFPGGLARVRCDAEIAGGVWSNSHAQALSGGSWTTSTGTSVELCPDSIVGIFAAFLLRRIVRESLLV